jgi:hypothetical protein
MAKIKKIIKAFIPPIIISTISFVTGVSKRRDLHKMWPGNFNSWTEAENLCTGYDNDLILDKY